MIQRMTKTTQPEKQTAAARAKVAQKAPPRIQPRHNIASTLTGESLLRLPNGLPIQPLLRVGSLNDKYEQEANRVADAVMRMSESPKHDEDGTARPHGIQVSPMQVAEQTDSSEAPPVVHESLCSPGQPLDTSMRTFMERRFGHDFRHVRVHADAKSAESAGAVNARAYTVGQDVVFGPEQYVPETTAGKRLLAHELTHVMQQQRASSRPVLHRQEAEEAGASTEKEQSAGQTDELAWSRSSDTMTERDISGQRFLLMNFGLGRAELKKGHAEFLLMTVYHSTLALDPLAKVTVIGYTDPNDSSKFRKRLSIQRAREVEKRLMEVGVRKDRIKAVMGKGSEKPMGDSKTLDGRARNRRVEVLVTPWKPAKPISTLTAESARGMLPCKVRLNNFASAPFPDAIKQSVEDAFKPMHIVRFDWKGTVSDADVVLSFDDTTKWLSKLGMAGAVFLRTFREREICRIKGDPSTCEKVLPNTPEMMGRALANTVCHEIGHQFGLDHVTALDNYMWSPEVHPLYVKEDKTYAECILLGRTLQCARARFNDSQIMRMMQRIKEKRKRRRTHPGVVEFE